MVEGVWADSGESYEGDLGESCEGASEHVNGWLGQGVSCTGTKFGTEGHE